MATIGLDDLYYATITEGNNGVETYGTPVKLAKAISADLSMELAEAILYADDAAAESVKAFKNGKISLGIDELGSANAAALLGARVDSKGVLVSATEDTSPYVAIGFRALKANGKYRYFWLYKVQFAVPSASLQTKGDNITFQTPTIEGTVIRRNKPDTAGKHPWKAEITEGETGADQTTITGWFTTVYEPSYT
ncbi:MAG: phage tail protein [Clostridia bacterium]|nr:phage tail protein [Clostridia bacterium]